MNNVMADLETLNTTPTSAILSIGAVCFDRSGLGDKFYVKVDLFDCLNHGLTVSSATLHWWSTQSNEAREVFDGKTVDLKTALTEFGQFLPDDCKLWGNGASFDNAILANAYAVTGLFQPWKFWNDRCYRTVVAGRRRRINTGVAHNALHDAISQANHLIQVNPDVIE